MRTVVALIVVGMARCLSAVAAIVWFGIHDRSIVRRSMTSNLLCFMALTFCVGDALAAELRQPMNDYETEMGCDLVLQGQIDSGDADQVTKSLVLFVGPVRMCLDSRGGSFSEAIKIVESMRPHPGKVATAIADESVCLSACAIIFMFGQSNSAYDGSLRALGVKEDRRMHPGAKLGFHAPKLEIPDGAYDKSTVLQAWTTATEAISELIRVRLLFGEGIFRDELVRAMLSTPQDRLFYIDTVAKAAIYNIGIYPVLTPDVPIAVGARNFCQNLLSNANGSESPPLSAATRIEVRPFNPDDRHSPNLAVAAFRQAGTGEYTTCNFTLILEYDLKGEGGLFGISNAPPRFSVNLFSVAPQFMFFEGAKRIDDLPRANAAAWSIQNIAIWLQPQDTAKNSDSPRGSFKRASWCESAATPTEIKICSSRILNQLEISTLEAYERVKTIEPARQVARDRLRIRNQCGVDEECLERTMNESLDILTSY